jgi:hypothetical protein
MWRVTAGAHPRSYRKGPPEQPTERIPEGDAAMATTTFPTATFPTATFPTATFPTATFPTAMTNRDRAVLRAVAAGRCRTSGEFSGSLVVDGLCLADQFTGPRLTKAGLIATSVGGPVVLTPSGRALLYAA